MVKKFVFTSESQGQRKMKYNSRKKKKTTIWVNNFYISPFKTFINIELPHTFHYRRVFYSFVRQSQWCFKGISSCYSDKLNYLQLFFLICALIDG